MQQSVAFFLTFCFCTASVTHADYTLQLSQEKCRDLRSPYIPFKNSVINFTPYFGLALWNTNGVPSEGFNIHSFVGFELDPPFRIGGVETIRYIGMDPWSVMTIGLYKEIPELPSYSNDSEAFVYKGESQSMTVGEFMTTTVSALNKFGSQTFNTKISPATDLEHTTNCYLFILRLFSALKFSSPASMVRGLMPLINQNVRKSMNEDDTAELQTPDEQLEFLYGKNYEDELVFLFVNQADFASNAQYDVPAVRNVYETSNVTAITEMIGHFARWSVMLSFENDFESMFKLSSLLPLTTAGGSNENGINTISSFSGINMKLMVTALVAKRCMKNDDDDSTNDDDESTSVSQEQLSGLLSCVGTHMNNDQNALLMCVTKVVPLPTILSIQTCMTNY